MGMNYLNWIKYYKESFYLISHYQQNFKGYESHQLTEDIWLLFLIHQELQYLDERLDWKQQIGGGGRGWKNNRTQREIWNCGPNFFFFPQH